MANEIDELLLEIARNQLLTDEHGCFKRRTLPDGRELAVFPITFGRARLGITNSIVTGFDDVW